ncbi:MAG: hypothetical protein QM791_02915 [Ferruginibacter sp.]
MTKIQSPLDSTKKTFKGRFTRNIAGSPSLSNNPTETPEREQPQLPPPVGTLNREQLQKLFENSPDLFDFIQNKNEKPPLTKYKTSPFSAYPKRYTKDGLRLTVIPFTEGHEMKTVFDNVTCQILNEQASLTETTVGELIRHAVWSLCETLTDSRKNYNNYSKQS